MRAHQLPNVKKQDLRKQKSKSNFTAFTVGVGGSTAATIEMHECPFCLEKSRQAFPMMVMRALYQKFAASQNYFYSKDVNEILQQQRGRALIAFKDHQQIDENEEYMKRIYTLPEYGGKIKMLSEYYKYHHDVPRLFMLPTSLTVSKYHDRKRRVEYVRITKMLNIQPEADSTHETQQQMPPDHKSLECLLDLLNDTKSRPLINIIDEHQGNHFIPQPTQKITLNTLQSESNTLQEINLRLGEMIAAASPNNPYMPTQMNSIMVQLAEERLSDMNLPKPFLRIDELQQRTNRKTEPDLKKNFDKPLQMHPATKRKMHSLASHQEQPPRSDTQIRNQINTFFQVTEQQRKSQPRKVTPLSSERQHSRSKNSVSPNRFTKTSRQQLETQTSQLSSQNQREKSAHSTRPLQLQEQRTSDLLRLLQRNPPQSKEKSFQKKPLSPAPITSKPKQDPIIAQLIHKLQQGNSNLFQQLLQLTATEKYRSKAPLLDDPPMSSSRQRGGSQQSLKRNTQRSAQQSQSNLSSLLRPVSRTKPTINPQNISLKSVTNRQKRVNSQNMTKESNPFHLNLDRISITAQQRIQTSRDTVRDVMPQRSVYQESISKRIRSRGSINTTTTQAQADTSRRVTKKPNHF